ncbi:MAG: hypothetical protein WA001_00900 [Patescibacteria group bacterium]
MNRFYSLAALSLVFCLVGAGCSSSSPSAKSSGPQPAAFTGLSPKDAALKVNLVSPDVIVVHQSFSGQGAQIAEELGWGDAATTTVTIQQFAPENSASFEWLRDTEVASGTQMAPMQATGTIASIDLLKSHSVTSPSYWQKGDYQATGSGILWLSQYAFDDLTKAKSGTFSFDFVEPDFIGSVKTPTFTKAITALNASVKATIDHTDVYLAKADDPSVMTVKLNGVDTKVQAVTAHTWFGSFTFLDNPSNPLVLQLTTDPKVMGDLSSFFDFQVTELQGLTQ